MKGTKTPTELRYCALAESCHFSKWIQLPVKRIHHNRHHHNMMSWQHVVSFIVLCIATCGSSEMLFPMTYSSSETQSNDAEYGGKPAAQRKGATGKHTGNKKCGISKEYFVIVGGLYSVHCADSVPPQEGGVVCV